MNDPDGLVSETFLAGVLGLSTRRLRQLAADGVLAKEGRGEFRLAASVQAHAAWRLKSELKRSGGGSAQAELDRLKVARERKRQMREDREIVTLEESFAALDEVVGTVRSELDGLPARITRDRALRAQIEKAVFDALERISAKLDEAADGLTDGEGG